MNFKKEIENFGNDEIKESVIASIYTGEASSLIANKYKVTKSYVNLIKNQFLELLYEKNKIFFEEIFENCFDYQVLLFSQLAKKDKKLVHAVLLRLIKQKYSNDLLLSQNIIIKKDFYNKAVEIIKKDKLPLAVNELAAKIKCTVPQALLALDFHKENGFIFFYDQYYIYTNKSGAFKLIDSVAQLQDAGLQELYEIIKKIGEDIPKTISTYEKFTTLVKTRLSNSNKGVERFHNLLNIGPEGIVTKKRAFNSHNLSDSIVKKIIEECVDIAKRAECQIDTQYLLEELENKEYYKAYCLNPVFLKSILVLSGEFEQGRKYNVALKEKQCNIKSLDEIIESIFEKNKKDSMRAREIYQQVMKSGRVIAYSNFLLSLKKNFKLLESNRQETGLFSKERISAKKLKNKSQ